MHGASAIQKNRYGVRPSSAYSFGDQLGLVRGTKSKIEDGYDTGTSLRHVVAVGDFAGAQPLRVQVVLELSHFLLLSAALSQPTNAVGPSAMGVLPYAELQPCWPIEESFSASSCAHAPSEHA